MTSQQDNAAVSGRGRHRAIHGEIRRRICLLIYPPGLRLSETELAQDFGISRTPLRRVLARLEDEGLVQSQHGIGTLVTDAGIDQLAEVYRLRVELTALTGRLDPVQADAAFLQRFERLIARSRQIITGGSAQEFTEFDIEVFETLLELVGNPPLRQVLERLYYQTKRIWLQFVLNSRLDLQDEFRIFHHELEAIRLALRAGDPAALADVQRAHISMSFQRLLQQKP